MRGVHVASGGGGIGHEQEAGGHGEGAVLAEGDPGGGAQRAVDSGVLPAAQAEGMSVLLVAAKGTTFALVSDAPGELDAGIELVLADGRRIRIRRGVDEAALRTVLSAVGPEGC